MNKYTFYKIVCLSAVSILGFSSQALGADDYNSFYQSRTTKYDTMEAIKKDISRLIAENNRLEARYSKLKEKWNAVSVDMQLNQHQNQEPSKEAFVQTKNLDMMEDDVYLPEENTINQQRQNRFINGELADYKEGLSLRELRLADLQYYRRELELELKMIEVQKQDKQREVLGKLDRIKADLQGAIQREKQLIQLITRKEEAVKVAPKETPILETDNKKLEEVILALEKRNQFKEREISILKDKKLLKEKASEEILAKIEREKIDLKTKVEDLQDEHNDLSDSVSHSLQRQERKHELLQEIIFFDQENQRLQAKISELADQIEYHDK